MAGAVKLTRRQVQCTILAGRGLTEGEIAQNLGVAPGTVKRHLKDARRAYNVDKTMQLVTHALADGVFTLDDLI
jgi:DNA-binding CsgD family transcriptional regulator